MTPMKEPKKRPHNLSPSPKTSIATEKTKRLQVQVLELYGKNPNMMSVSREMGLSYAYCQKLYRNALKSIVVESVEDYRKLEMKRLDTLHQKAMEVLEAFHPLVNAGQVVRDTIDDEYGNPIINSETEQVLTRRLQDQAPLLQAIDKVLKISERRSRLLGLDMPTKVAATDPSGEKEASSNLSRMEIIGELKKRGLPTTVFGIDEETSEEST